MITHTHAPDAWNASFNNVIHLNAWVTTQVSQESPQQRQQLCAHPMLYKVLPLTLPMNVMSTSEPGAQREATLLSNARASSWKRARQWHCRCFPHRQNLLQSACLHRQIHRTTSGSLQGVSLCPPPEPYLVQINTLRSREAYVRTGERANVPQSGTR